MRKGSHFHEIEGYSQVMQDKKTSLNQGSNLQQESLITSTIIERLHPKKLFLKVTEIIDELSAQPGNVKTIRLTRINDTLPVFEAGQYINLSVNVDDVTTSRAYSLSSAPSQSNYFDITIKRVEEGFVSNYLLDKVKVGDEFESTGPAGEFHYNPIFHGDDLLMLAGGSGITPIMSMIREFTTTASTKTIHLIYICRTPADIIFCKELESIEQQNSSFTFTKVISRPEDDYEGITGHINAELLTSLIQDINNKTCYICGPTGMCQSVKDELLGLGVRPGKIRQESFGESSDITKMPGWPAGVTKGNSVNVQIIGGERFQAPVGEPLLNSLDRASVTIPSSCHAGECSLCRVKLVAGDVFQLANSKERVSDKKYGYIHSCCSYPVNDIAIEI